NQQNWTAVTIDGTFIASMPNFDSAKATKAGDVAWGVSWMTDGSFLVCASKTTRALRWDLFSPLKPLVASTPNMPCLDAAN
ncbi:MAG TPA: hypothetical protein VGM78_09240, partial [Ilumatobacteraceae bacterium]